MTGKFEVVIYIEMVLQAIIAGAIVWLAYNEWRKGKKKPRNPT